MSADVSSWFVSQELLKISSPLRIFTLSNSDYSSHVIKWPKFKYKWNDIRPKNLTINLSNEDQSFNFFSEDKTVLVQPAKLRMGFGEGSNQLLYSEQFSHDSWGYTFTEVLSDGIAPPSTLSRAWKIRSIGIGSAQRQFYQTMSLSLVNQDIYYTASIFAKAGTLENCAISFDGEWFSEMANAVFNISANSGGIDVTSNGSSSIESYGNGWYRCSVTGVGSGASSNVPIARFWLANSGSLYTDVVSGYIYASGGHFRENIFPSSYDATSDHAGVELVDMFNGTISEVSYDKGSTKLIMTDKFKQLSEREIGTNDVPASYISSNYLPSDIAWYAITSYGGYSTIASDSNPDINYSSWLEWSNVFSADAVLMNAEFNGQKIVEVLKRIGRQTESAIYIERGRVAFKRFSLANTYVTSLDNTNIRELNLKFNNNDTINKQWVNAAYDVDSKDFYTTVFEVSTSSINSFGLMEDTVEDSRIWYVNSSSALNLAQRIIKVKSDPYNQISIDTTLVGMTREIGETVSVVDSFMGIDEGYRIMQKEIDMDKGRIKFGADRSQFFNAFILDASTLDSADVLT